MKALNPTILIAALLVSSGFAQAAETGWYGAVSLGSAKSDGSAIHEGSHAPNTPSYGVDDAAVGGFAIGYKMGNGSGSKANCVAASLTPAAPGAARACGCQRPST